MGTTVRCMECHCSNVQIKGWTNPNDDNGTESDFMGDMLDEVNDCWCEDCQMNNSLDGYDDELLLKEANDWWNNLSDEDKIKLHKKQKEE